MDKKVRKYKLGEEPENDLSFWISKSPAERLAALQVLRERYIKLLLLFGYRHCEGFSPEAIYVIVRLLRFAKMRNSQ